MTLFVLTPSGSCQAVRVLGNGTFAIWSISNATVQKCRGVSGKAELWLSPFLRCSNSIFWRTSGEILVKVRWIPVKFRWNSNRVSQTTGNPQKHNSASPQGGPTWRFHEPGLWHSSAQLSRIRRLRKSPQYYFVVLLGEMTVSANQISAIPRNICAEKYQDPGSRNSLL